MFEDVGVARLLRWGPLFRVEQVGIHAHETGCCAAATSPKRAVAQGSSSQNQQSQQQQQRSRSRMRRRKRRRRRRRRRRSRRSRSRRRRRSGSSNSGRRVNTHSIGSGYYCQRHLPQQRHGKQGQLSSLSQWISHFRHTHLISQYPPAASLVPHFCLTDIVACMVISNVLPIVVAVITPFCHWPSIACSTGNVTTSMGLGVELRQTRNKGQRATASQNQELTTEAVLKLD